MGQTRRRHVGGISDFFDKASAHSLNPTIINSDSNFVVVTYWWGRGNLNKNTQLPCIEDMQPGEALTQQPIKFEDMIDGWIKSCKGAKCNYLVEEYPEFAVKGGYQHAINFKPAFIKLALKACAPRSVLYIDGDMRMNFYPSIFDIREVDYMGRSWNTDPRLQSTKQRDWYCFDPYGFEMSGGTMFFANTFHANKILDTWISESKRYPGKSDDRILSLAFMRYRMIVPITSIQLPLEFLWIPMYHSFMLTKESYKKKLIAIEHPACITGEDRASSEGAAADRMPRGYTTYVEKKIRCTWEDIYEYVHFDNPEHAKSFQPYFNWLSDNDVADVYPYKRKYGPFNEIADKNEKLKSSVDLKIKDKNVVVSKHLFKTPSLHQVEDKSMMIPTILKYLENGQNVIYIPEKPNSVRWIVERVANEQLDFVTRNNSKTVKRIKPEFYLEMDHSYPIYFGGNNSVLKHLVRMSDSFEGMQKVFNRSYIFLTRIHCGWI